MVTNASVTTVDGALVGASTDAVAQSWAQARAAAERSSAVIELVHDIAEMRAMGAVLDSIWKTDSGSPEVEPRLMVAIAEAGGYIAGVRVGGQLVGAAVGFPRHPHGLHSHIVGVLPAYAGRGVGTALKLHQRAWCLERGISLITWTFDPLVARNAHLNLTRLGVTAPRYLVDHYGPMHDSLNSDDPSDRLLVYWDLLSPRTGEPPQEPAVTVLADRSGEPVPLGAQSVGALPTALPVAAGAAIGAVAAVGAVAPVGAGPGATVPVATVPVAAGPVAAVPVAAVPVAAVPVAAVPVAAGPMAGGPVAAGPMAGGPVAAVAPGTDRILVAVPGDIEALRRTDPLLALRWRLAVREALHPRVESGWVIEGFRADHHYVLTRPGLRSA